MEKDDPPLSPAVTRQLQRQIEIQDVKANVGTLLRYATTYDYIVLSISAVVAIAGGAALPVMSIAFGRLAGVLNDAYSGVLDQHDLNDKTVNTVLYLIYLAIGEFFTVALSTAGFMHFGERISCSIREQFVKACLRQNIGFYDTIQTGELTTRITADTNLLQDGISEKLGLAFAALATFVSALVVCFANHWKLTLMLCSMAVSIIMTMAIGSHLVTKWGTESYGLYAEGDSLANEVLGSVRIAMAFGSQEKLAQLYDGRLAKAEKPGFRMQATFGIMLGVTFLIMYLGYALSFWQGARFLGAGDIRLASVVTILLAIMTGTFSVGNMSSNFQALIKSLSVAAKIFAVIDRQSPIDPTSGSGSTLPAVRGEIRFENVKMIYPSRPEVTVMKDLSLTIPAGQSTAIVGASGSSKSTIISLLHRFYEPIDGKVLLDGHDITTLDPRWIRRQMPLVGQESMLFNTSIYNNIAHGFIGADLEHSPPDAKREAIEQAAKLANAHDFISNLPKSYSTEIGESGGLLSGGQKQRIAIARAIVSNPKILLLDEATSALDSKSEKVVQAALDSASGSRTTVIIAHRLSTVKKADKIIVLSNGAVVEEGTHTELLEKGGVYSTLISKQQINEKKSAIEEATDAATSETVLRQEKTEMQSFEHSVKNYPDGGIDEEAGEISQPSENSKQHVTTWTLIRTVARLNLPEQHWMVLGLLCSILCGAGIPVSAVFLAKLIVAMTQFNVTQDRALLTSDTSFWSIMYIALAAGQLLSFSIEGVAFAYCSERLVRRARMEQFRHMLRQDASYFDKMTTAELTATIAGNASNIAGLSGTTLGSLLNVVTTLLGSLILSIAIGWKLALVTASSIPILIVCGYLRFGILSKYQVHTKKCHIESATGVCEAIAMIRTTASLGLEHHVAQSYSAALGKQRRLNILPIIKSSILYAVSQSLVFLCMALGFWYGGTLVIAKEYTVLQFYICFAAIIFGAQSAGTVFSYAPDMGKARQAALEVHTLFSRQPSIDTWSCTGEQLESMQGNVEFRNCRFHYPMRPETEVLQGVNVTIEPGQFVAFVGSSGGGKSTLLSLLQRFYDPTHGSVLVDGVDTRSLNLNNYRTFLSLVAQEPALYEGTIRDNISLGALHDITDEEIEAACKDANIHEFIMSLPNGISTMVGSKGALLSGGQKQRIAIARALVRQPQILLLDEPTSALDSNSEAEIQTAIRKAAKGRTTVVVAHRLCTVQNADMIYVLKQGRVVEQGTHAQLMMEKGLYYEMAELQQLDTEI